jgi:hypothetical protein
MLLVLAQSGFSEVDVSSFRIENLKGLDEAPETERYVVEKPREKTGEMQATCFSYEALHDIRIMLQERDNPSEGYLFVSTTKGKDDKLEVRSINTAMKKLAHKSLGKEKAKEFQTKSLEASTTPLCSESISNRRSLRICLWVIRDVGHERNMIMMKSPSKKLINVHSSIYQSMVFKQGLILRS